MSVHTGQEESLHNLCVLKFLIISSSLLSNIFECLLLFVVNTLYIASTIGFYSILPGAEKVVGVVDRNGLDAEVSVRQINF